VKKTAASITLVLLLVIFPLLGSGAFADFIGTGALPMNLLTEPLTMLLFGACMMVVGTGLRKI
jgi:hypothetical protein